MAKNMKTGSKPGAKKLNVPAKNGKLGGSTAGSSPKPKAANNSGSKKSFPNLSSGSSLPLRSGK